MRGTAERSIGGVWFRSQPLAGRVTKQDKHKYRLALYDVSFDGKVLQS